MAKRCSTSRVAVDLRQDEARRVHLAHELAGLCHRVLSRHRIGRHQDVIGARGLLDPSRLLHHLGVDVQSPGGVDDHDVGVLARGLGQRVLRDLDRIAPFGPDGNADLAPQGPQLLHRRRALQVRGDQ